MLGIKPRLPIVNRHHVHARSLVACYPFFERGGITIHDVVNKKGNGTFTFLALGTDWQTHRLGAAMQFTAVDTASIACGFANIANNLYYTITAWILAGNSTVAADQEIFSEGNSGDDAPMLRFSIKASTNLLGFTARDDGGTTNSSPIGVTSVKDGVWHHVAITRNNTIWTIYLDGKVDVSTTKSISTSTMNRTTIGALGRVADIAYFNGKIAELRIYKRTLAVKELLTLTANPWALYFKNRASFNFVPILFSQRITEVLQRVQYNVLNLDYEMGQTLTPNGKYLQMQLATEVPVSPPQPGGKGLIFFINASNVLKIYCWDGAAWRVN